MRPGVKDQPGQHAETPSLLKIQKLSWACWHVPVIPAARETEAGESLIPSRQRLRLHSSLGNKSETVRKEKKRKGKKEGRRKKERERKRREEKKKERGKKRMNTKYKLSIKKIYTYIIKNHLLGG